MGIQSPCLGLQRFSLPDGNAAGSGSSRGSSRMLCFSQVARKGSLLKTLLLKSQHIFTQTSLQTCVPRRTPAIHTQEASGLRRQRTRRRWRLLHEKHLSPAHMHGKHDPAWESPRLKDQTDGPSLGYGPKGQEGTRVSHSLYLLPLTSLQKAKGASAFA